MNFSLTEERLTESRRPWVSSVPLTNERRTESEESGPISRMNFSLTEERVRDRVTKKVAQFHD